MTINNEKEIRIIDSGYNYHPYEYGEFAGHPTVSLKLSSSNKNAKQVGTLDGMFQRWGWKQKVKSGYARFRFKGSDPLSEMHRDGIEAVDMLIDPTFVDFELDQQSITQEPSRVVKRIADHFTIFVPTDGSYDEDAMQYFTKRSRDYGDAEFVFNVGEHGDDEHIKQFSRDYKIYDSDIWLFPKGRKLDTVKESYDRCVKWSKQNSWNLSPRFDLWEQFAEEEYEG